MVRWVASYFSLCQSIWIPAVIVSQARTGELTRVEGEGRISYEQARMVGQQEKGSTVLVRADATERCASRVVIA